jgi:hypothetical protein
MHPALTKAALLAGLLEAAASHTNMLAQSRHTHRAAAGWNERSELWLALAEAATGLVAPWTIGPTLTHLGTLGATQLAAVTHGLHCLTYQYRSRSGGRTHGLVAGVWTLVVPSIEANSSFSWGCAVEDVALGADIGYGELNGVLYVVLVYAFLVACLRV